MRLERALRAKQVPRYASEGQKERQVQQQIPKGNDRKKGKSNCQSNSNSQYSGLSATRFALRSR